MKGGVRYGYVAFVTAIMSRLPSCSPVIAWPLLRTASQRLRSKRSLPMRCGGRSKQTIPSGPHRNVDKSPVNAMAKPDKREFPAARLLIVDDIADNRAVLTRRLARRGFEIVEADCGAEALRLVQEQIFDVVLLDVMMPDMDGMEVLRRIREKFSVVALAGRNGDRQNPVGRHCRSP